MTGPGANVRTAGAAPHAPGPRVAMDGRMLCVGTGSGVATYAANLRDCIALAGYAPGLLSAHPDAHPDVGAGPRRYSALARLARALPAGPHDAEAFHPAPASGFDAGWAAADVFRRAHLHMRLRGRLMRLRSSDPPEIMHWTYPVPMVFTGAANVYAVHDLIPLRQPALTPIRRGRHRRTMRQLLAAADHIVTVSETSRRQVIETLGCEPARVSNTYQAVDVDGPRSDVLPAGLAPGGYLLFCGVVEPRKNLLRLAEAHAAAGVDAILVIAGPDGWRGEAISARLANHAGVLRLPWLPRPQLLALMAGAAGLLMPSLAEGFGLPVAEAMALGAPVMTSRDGALAEIAGEAAILVDPLDVRGMAAAIAALASDPALRGRLAADGLRRAQTFSKAAHGRRLAAVYADVLDRRGRVGR